MENKKMPMPNSAMLSMLLVFPPLVSMGVWLIAWNVSGASDYEGIRSFFLSLQSYVLALLSLFAFIAAMVALLSHRARRNKTAEILLAALSATLFALGLWSLL